MTEETKKRDVKLQYSGMQVADHSQQRWGVKLQPNHVFEDVLNPAFWSIQANRFTQGDLIDIRTEDGRFYAEAYVTDVYNTGVKLQILRHVQLDGHIEGKVETAGYTVEWKGPSWKFCVIRKIDGAIMVKNLTTKEAAADWLEDNAKAA